MGKFSRDKGARHERKIAGILNAFFDWDLVRNLEQSRRDIHGDLVDRNNLKAPYNLIIECKNRVFSWDSFMCGESSVGPLRWVCEQLSKDDSKHVFLIFHSRTTHTEFAAFYSETATIYVPDELPLYVSGDLCVGELNTMMEFVKWNLNNL